MKTLKKSTAFYKDPSTGDFKSLNVIGEKTAAELKAEIEAKGQETLESIPDDYTALSEEVSQLSSEIVDLNCNKISNIDMGCSKIYQVRVYNSLNEEHTAPIELKVNFPIGEVLSINHLILKRTNGDIFNLQYEPETHPCYYKLSNIGYWHDGSLRSGSIWFVDTIGANTYVRYFLEVFAQKVASHSENIIPVTETYYFTLPNNINIEMQNNITGVNYRAPGNLVRYEFDGVDLFANRYSPCLSYVKLTDDTEITIANANFSIARHIENNGAIFVDYIVESKYLEMFKIITKYRIFIDGSIYFSSRLEALQNTSIKGYFNRIQVVKNSDFEIVKSTDKGTINVSVNGSNVNFALLPSVIRYSLKNDETDYGGTVGSASSTEISWLDFGIRGDELIDLKQGDGFYISYCMGFNSVNKLVNRLTAHVTDTPISMRKADILRLASGYLQQIKTAKYNAQLGEDKKPFTALEAYTDICVKIANNDTISEEDINLYLNGLTSLYGGYTSSSFYDAWTNGTGIEFIGRNVAPMWNIYKICVKNNIDTTNIINAIHGCADFYVSAEQEYGANGALGLSYTRQVNIYNPQTAAMRGLYTSLQIEENVTRRKCYKRIKENVLSGIWNETIFPYAHDSTLMTGNVLHYSLFTVFDYINAVDSFDFSVREFPNMITTASGKLKEMEWSFPCYRYGFIHSTLYAAYILYRCGTPSDLETAYRLLQNLMSRSYPEGGREYPLDGWEKQITGYSESMEAQICGDIVFEMMFK